MLSSPWGMSSTTWFAPPLLLNAFSVWSMHGQMWILMREKLWNAMSAKETCLTVATPKIPNLSKSSKISFSLHFSTRVCESSEQRKKLLSTWFLHVLAILTQDLFLFETFPLPEDTFSWKEFSFAIGHGQTPLCWKVGSRQLWNQTVSIFASFRSSSPPHLHWAAVVYTELKQVSMSKCHRAQQLHWWARAVVGRARWFICCYLASALGLFHQIPTCHEIFFFAFWKQTAAGRIWKNHHETMTNNAKVQDAFLWADGWTNPIGW